MKELLEHRQQLAILISSTEATNNGTNIRADLMKKIDDLDKLISQYITKEASIKE